MLLISLALVIFKQTRLLITGGVLEDVLGLEDVLEDTFWSPWPRSLKFSKIALFSARGQHNSIFEPLKFRWKTPETLRKICKKLFFWFPQVEIAWKKFLRTFFAWKKIWSPYYFWDRLKKIFEDVFFYFLENTCVCVLGPWPWPRESLSLALSLVSSTPPLLLIFFNSNFVRWFLHNLSLFLPYLVILFRFCHFMMLRKQRKSFDSSRQSTQFYKLGR